MNDPVVLAEVMRGGLLESLHLGAVAVADAEGRILHKAGDPSLRTFWRSSMKPVQALALAESGALEAFGLGDESLAIACASHNGEPMHVAAVDAMLRAAGLSEKDLGCGVHPPYSDPRTRRQYEDLLASGFKPDARHNNCSGKHAGMLVACRHKGLSTARYLKPSHPHQRRIRELVETMTGANNPEAGTDGCSAPIYRLSLSEMATAYARLVRPPKRLEAPCARVVSAMTAHPLLVHSEGGFDSELMRAAPERVVSKRGAEGVACFALRKEGLGVAIKALDGNGRATQPATLSVLRQLGILDEALGERLRPIACPSLRNHRGAEVGEIRPGPFRLEPA